MDTLKIALIQTDLDWENPQANLQRFRKLITNNSFHPQLIVLPEMFTTGFTMNASAFAEPHPGPTFQWMRQTAEKHQATLVGSIIVQENKRFYNRLYAVLPNGKYYFYDKRHLFSYAGENKIFSPGNQKLIFNCHGWKICPLICYDLRFPIWSRNVENYDILLYVANWPDSRIAAWNALLPARAIENLCYSIGVNRIGTDEKGISYSGKSAVYNLFGKKISKIQEPSIITAVLNKKELLETREKLGFLNDKDSFDIVEKEE